jgi:formylglycine-generating enzyme required for sulfatase activity
MVAIQTPKGWYCMDSTEVSEDHYATFIDTNPSTAGQPEVCAWNDTYVGLHVEPYEHSDRPRTGIDWCDARAYCAWAGKRLCGAIGGGPASYQKYANAAASEWYFACSRGGERVYPYGNTFDEWACLTGEYPTNPPAPWDVDVDSCLGGFSGLLNMSGNVAEWEDSCQHPTNPISECRIRGGSRAGLQEMVWCQSDSVLGRTNTSAFIGFRCCADAVPPE